MLEQIELLQTKVDGAEKWRRQLNEEYAFSTPELADGWSTGKPQMTDEKRSDVEKIDELETWLTK
ncbi:hypothetical protein PC113_g22685 [Phytophthora cactorum]|uniref:Uncharacterized protein n=1 Tax=Phytophthora cactorum TaxID=29920 RepID=A0A8T0XXF3_9STRA|nr:hypothetical protein PC113_g22685 [Phytophthora cactorum]KAG2886375.1 hypothetical protein PC117_g25395 [Phytophthora cactorum]KAG2980051.1 hypothetical protein PC120_g25035 [Phytophthora cactorum]